MTAGDCEGEEDQLLLNIRIGRSENRQLVTGWHVVADISCNTCSTKLGWKYVDAKEDTQKYKIGKYILETERVVTFSFWEDCDHSATLAAAVVEEEGEEDGRDSDHSSDNDGPEGRSSADDAIVFDSENEEECDDIFAGTWNAETVARRRGRMVAQARPGDV